MKIDTMTPEKSIPKFFQGENDFSDKTIFISWAAYCSRSDNIAREFGSSSYMIYCGALGSNLFTVWLKYLIQFLKTQHLLFTQRPKFVFVMTPPIFAVLSVYVYSLLNDTSYIIDAHTATFLHPRWRHLQWLQHFLCRRALTTIVTNEYLASQVEAHGGHATIIRDVPIIYNVREQFSINDKFSLAVVCSFNYDEPIEEIFQAAQRLPDAQFYITGDPKFLNQSLANNVPNNVTLTGFLSNSAYISLLSKANIVMTFTTRDHTMLRGAYEAVYQGTPVIISDWSILKDSFSQGAIHVNNSSEQMIKAVREMQTHYDLYKTEVLSLREQKYQIWERQKSLILALMRGQ